MASGGGSVVIEVAADSVDACSSTGSVSSMFGLSEGARHRRTQSLPQAGWVCMQRMRNVCSVCMHEALYTCRRRGERANLFTLKHV